MSSDGTFPALRRALRSLRRSPGFVAIAAISLGTALGLSTAVFAMMDAMTHPESAFRNVDQLYAVTIRRHSKLGPARAEVMKALGAISGVEGLATFRPDYSSIEAGDGEERRIAIRTRPGFFELLGVRPRLGRLPTRDEATNGQVAVVSDALWRRKFENRRTIGDASISAGLQQYRVVGVLPPGATLPYWQSPDAWIPDLSGDVSGEVPVIRVRGGLGDSVSAQSRLEAILKRWTHVYTQPNERPFSGQLVPMRPDPLELKDFHRAMIGAAACVLLIACANVAALMLARGMIRRRDYALRLALGAGPGEIAGEVIVEVVVLAVVGSVVGALVATWVVALITGATPDEMRWMGFVQPQWSTRVLALSGLAVLASIAVAGGYPAWQAGRTDPAGPLKESGGGTTGHAGTRFRWLVMAELALSMTLVMGSSLMVKSTSKLKSYEFGYDAHGLFRAYISYGWRDSTWQAERERLWLSSLARIRALPGVQSVAAMWGCSTNVITSDLTLETGENTYLTQGCSGVTPDFLRTVGVPIVRGRDFSEGDVALGGAVILGERAERRLFPRQSALGHMVKLGGLDSRRPLPWLRVVGVVREIELGFNPFPEVGPDTSAHVYAALPMSAGGLVVRPDPRSKGVELAVARTLRATLPPRVFASVGPWDTGYQQTLRGEQFISLVFFLLGAASLALGAAGLFSVISYVAGQRMREFAVRIALGATRDKVLRLVMREGLVMALGGTAVGAALGMRAGFMLWDKMYGVYPVDAGALVAGEVTLLLVTMLACLVPALRATRANPVEILRSA